MRDAAKAALLILAILAFGAGVHLGAAAIAPLFVPNSVAPSCISSHVELRVQFVAAEAHDQQDDTIGGRLDAINVCDQLLPDPPSDPSSSGSGHL